MSELLALKTAASELSADEALELATDILREHTVAYKMWLSGDIAEVVEELADEGEIPADQVHEVTRDTIENSSFWFLEYYRDSEWAVIRELVQDSIERLK